MPITAQQASALTRAISPDRLASYSAAAATSTTGATALDLYIWDRDLAVAILADVAVLEVALRNALHTRLTATFGGQDWYTRAGTIGLDERARKDISRAVAKVPTLARTPGRVVAQLMFGFWIGLLDTGAAGTYENDLWRPALSHAFLGGKVEARAVEARRVASSHGGDPVTFTREWTHPIASTVHAFRNRAAHHESLLTGVPLPGQFHPDGTPVRISIRDGHARCLQLARLLDRDLASWLATNTTVPATLAARP